jgi:glycolate oxidase
MTADLIDALTAAVGGANLMAGDAVKDDHTHDEALTATPVTPLAVVLPGSAEEVAAVLRVADERRVPVTARGAGTGMSGACIPRPDGIVVAFERMASIVEIDVENFVAVVEPGVQLDQLDAELAPLGLVYPVFPGEYSSSLGGNVGTNAGGMRAVKYGVTRSNVLGVEAVLPSGEVIRDGGKMVKRSSGYDLTQLIIGSEGTLALVTKVWLRLHARQPHQATLLAPFRTLPEVTAAVPAVVRSGVGPLMLEYIDMLTMASATAYVGLDLGIPDHVREAALAYLVVALEGSHADRVEVDAHAVAELLSELGAVDVYVLPAGSAAGLIDAREKAFWVAKANGADDIIDVVVPRASMPAFVERVAEIASEHQAWIAGCGHAGDGNVHMAVFQKDPEIRGRIVRALLAAGLDLGGAVSGEHGLGTEKSAYYRELEDPAKLALLARIKAAFDPHGILNPGTILEPTEPDPT